MLRPSPALAGFCLSLFAVACGGGEEASSAGRGGGPRGGDRSVPVEVTIAELGRVSRTTTLSGLVQPLRVSGVTAQLAGALGPVRALEGTVVREGEVLATITVPELAAQLMSAEAALKFAKSTAARSEALLKDEIVTLSEVELNRANLAAAQAAYAGLRARAAFATVRAPMSGVITERFVESGDVVSPNQRLFTIADVSTLVTVVQVSDLEVGALSKGQDVQLTVDAVPGRAFQGRIRRIFPQADSVTRMIPVEIAFVGSSTAKLRPGYAARATFRFDAEEEAVLIPARAVLGTTGGQAVFVINQGKPTRQQVRLGAETNGQVVVLSGVAAGDSVIVAGATSVREGSVLRIVDPLAPEEGGAARRRTATADSAIVGPVSR